jgi:CubicO group peptidase (beta-lactamase class C family)
MKPAYWPTTAWREAAPESVGIDPVGLAALDREIEARYRSINGLVLIAGGCLAYERYGGGFGPDDAHDLASVTKSVTSALIGIAIAQGHIEGVGQKVLDHFPEAAPRAPESLWHALTIEHLLTMTAGLHWRTGARAFEPMMARMWRSPDWVAFALSLPVLPRAWGTFQYNSACSHLLSAILARATGRPAREYANEHLFAPLGMAVVHPPGERPRPHRPGDPRSGAVPPSSPRPGPSPAPIQPPDSHQVAGSFQGSAGGSLEPRWPTDPQGVSTGGWGLALRPRDMARFGYLYLRRGEWDGVQIVPASWVDASLTAHTPGYGYQWWLRDLDGLSVSSAIGRGGHHIYVVPALDLVVAIASQPAGRWHDRWALLEGYILPLVS